MLYMSTDYVCDSLQGGHYCEEAPTNPTNTYGRSKLQGEEHLQAIPDRYFVVRTSWPFGPKERATPNRRAVRLGDSPRETGRHE